MGRSPAFDVGINELWRGCRVQLVDVGWVSAWVKADTLLVDQGVEDVA
jgi:hypothetical protein